MERPIIFSVELIPRILDGTKTQTRRVIKPQPYYDETVYGQGWVWQGLHHQSEADVKQLINFSGKCPYGQAGDRFWVRETGVWDPKTEYVAYKANMPDLEAKWQPSIFMPRWASRSALEITKIKVERLQEITPHDCICEGIIEAYGDGLALRDKFESLWDSLNAKRGYSWESNPFVWVIDFRRV